MAYNLGQGWLILELTNSPLLVGLAPGLSGLTSLVTSIWGGVLADRLNRKHVLIGGHIVLATTLLSLGLLEIMAVLEPWHIMLAAMAQGLIRGTQYPARNSLTYDIVGRERVQNAIGGQFMATNAAFVIGPLIAGFVLVSAGAGNLFLALGGIALVAILMLVRVGNAPRTQQQRPTSIWEDLKEGATFAIHDRATKGMLTVVAVTESVGFATLFMLPVVVRDLLHADAVVLGLVTALWGVGGVSSTLVISVIGDIHHKGRVFIGASALLGFALLAFSFSRNLPLSLCLVFLAGAAGAIYDTMGNTLSQTIAPESLRGRVAGFYSFMISGVQLGSFGMGAVAEFRGIAFAVGLGGSLVASNALRLAPLARRLTERSSQPAGSSTSSPKLPG